MIKIIRSLTDSPNGTTPEELKKIENKTIIRDSNSQAITELKVKKMNGEVLTASIGEIIRMKQEENKKKQ